MDCEGLLFGFGADDDGYKALRTTMNDMSVIVPVRLCEGVLRYQKLSGFFDLCLVAFDRGWLGVAVLIDGLAFIELGGIELR